MGTTVTFFKAREKKSVSNIRPIKLRLIGALGWPVPTYDSEAWKLKKQEEKRIQAFENKRIRKMMKVFLDKIMTLQVYELADTRRVLLKHVRGRKLRYYGHVMRQPWDNIEGSLLYRCRDFIYTSDLEIQMTSKSISDYPAVTLNQFQVTGGGGNLNLRVTLSSLHRSC